MVAVNNFLGVSPLPACDAFHHCEQHAAAMKRSYVLVALLLGVLFGPSVAKITSNPVEKDDRAIILIVRPFGFEPDGACSAVLYSPAHTARLHVHVSIVNNGVAVLTVGVR